MENETIQNLREALQHSPGNIPLILHLAETLFNLNELDKAEDEFKNALTYDDLNSRAKFGLAKIYFRKGKFSTASVILEELCASSNPAESHLILYCRVLIKENSFKEAAKQYERVLKINPDIKDEELDNFLRTENQVPGLPNDEPAIHFVQQPSVNFDDVGGMERVKREIDLKIIKPLSNPEIYKAYGKKIGGGILLYGPPGCGKTHLARATAGQVKAKFINIGITDVLDMWTGNSEKNLHEIFNIARKNSPCVLFFDEVDALGANRSDMRGAGGRHIINQFLSEMDGLDSNNDGLLILAATNAPWHVDPAFRRPGRFDRVIFVEPPDDESRVAILKILLQEKPAEQIDYKSIAKVTPEFSGADLKALIDIAIESMLEESIELGMAKPITTKNILNGLKNLKPTTREWFNTARNYALYANESGQYDDIVRYLKLKK